MPDETDRPRRPAGSTTPASQPGILAQLDPMVQPQRACIIHARTNAQDHGPCTGYIYLPTAANNARRASRHRPRPSCAAVRATALPIRAWKGEPGGTAARAGGRRPGHEGRVQKLAGATGSESGIGRRRRALAGGSGAQSAMACSG